MKATRAVGAVVFDDAGRVLLVLRGSPPRAGTWSLPGGKIESGESVHEATTREVLEETGITVACGPTVEVVMLDGDGYRYEIHEVLCTLPTAARNAHPRGGDDAREARWCTRDEAIALPVTPEVLRVIDAAREAAALS